MKATIGHIGINVSIAARSFPLWEDLCAYFGFAMTEDGKHFDASDGKRICALR